MASNISLNVRCCQPDLSLRKTFVLAVSSSFFLKYAAPDSDIIKIMVSVILAGLMLLKENDYKKGTLTAGRYVQNCPHKF